jgi:hypothetical protein
VSIVNSQIYSNTAPQVRASHACKLPIAPMGKFLKCSCRPDGKHADALALILACTTGSTTGGAYHRDLDPMGNWLTACLDSRLHNCKRRFGQLQLVSATETFKSSPM